MEYIDRLRNDACKGVAKKQNETSLFKSMWIFSKKDKFNLIDSHSL